MVGPLASVKFIHNAFRRDLDRIKSDIKFLATLGDGDVPLITRHFGTFNEYPSVHEMAEEEILFPAIDALVPGTAVSYVEAHRALDGLREQLLAALQVQDASKAFDAVMELGAALSAHLDREENELVPLCDEHISPQNQGKIAGEMAAKIPHDQMAAIVPWMVRLLSPDDREGVGRMWQMAMPAPAFARIKAAVQGALKPAQWDELAGRIPELVS